MIMNMGITCCCSIVLVFSLLLIIPSISSLSCSYPVVFAFGDSLYDTGNAKKSRNIALVLDRPDVSPYGETYFGHPANRYSDGRLSIDFLVQSLGLPFLNPFLDISSPGAQFSHGVNYAVAGALATNISYSISNRVFTLLTPLTLGVQLEWHRIIRWRVERGGDLASNLPQKSDFSKALYCFAIGGNDYGAFVLSRKPLTQILNVVVPIVVKKITDAVEVLYESEARHFLIQGVTPEGCAPLYQTLANRTDLAKLDANGCKEVLNQLGIVHNNQLQAAIRSLRQKYTDISITYQDIYSFYEDVLQNPSNYGFTNTLGACCGAGPTKRYQFSLLHVCGRRGFYVCQDPSSFVVWDGIHPTDSFNRQFVNKLIGGEFLDPSDVLACGASV